MAIPLGPDSNNLLPATAGGNWHSALELPATAGGNWDSALELPAAAGGNRHSALELPAAAGRNWHAALAHDRTINRYGVDLPCNRE